MLAGLSPREVVKRAVRDFLRDDMLTYAAAQAFHTMLALLPFLVFLLALLGFLQIPGVFTVMIEELERLRPDESLNEVVTVLAEVREGRGGLLTLGILGAIWAASTAIRAGMNALNRAYDITERRPVWKRYVLSLVYTLLVPVLLIISVGVLLTGPLVASWLGEDRRFGPAIAVVWTFLRVPVAMLLLLVAASAVFLFAPARKQRVRSVLPGAVVAVVLWVGTSLLFQLYIQNFGRYGMLYGSLSAVVVLLLYLFLSAAVLLFGAELNAVIAHEAASSAE